MKHAYLIMAYNNAEQLKNLISLLDDERNDIFLHIDKGSIIENIDFTACTKYSKVFLAPSVSVRWAHYSQFQAELNLLKTATNNGEYKYYHLLSGMDMPTKTQDEIHEFFDDKNCEFVAIKPEEFKYSIEHVKFSYSLLKCKNFRSSKFLKILQEVFIRLQKLFCVNRVKKLQKQGWHFFDGWTWFSITDNFARYLIDNEKFIKKLFAKSKASDEMVLPTLIMNSDFKDKTYSFIGFKTGSQRLIDWGRGKPYTFTDKDFDELVNSEFMFARKFDYNKNSKIIEMLTDYLVNKSKNG